MPSHRSPRGPDFGQCVVDRFNARCQRAHDKNLRVRLRGRCMHQADAADSAIQAFLEHFTCCAQKGLGSLARDGAARCEPQGSHCRMSGQTTRRTKQDVVLRVDPSALKPDARQFQMLHDMPAPERLARCWKPYCQHVPSDHFGSGLQREHSAVLRQAGIEGQSLQWKPFKPRAGLQLRKDLLHSGLSQTAVKARGPGGCDESVGVCADVHGDLNAVATDQATRRVHQNMVANSWAFWAQGSQDPHSARMLPAVERFAVDRRVLEMQNRPPTSWRIHERQCPCIRGTGM